MIRMRQAIGRLEHHRLRVPDELEVGFFGEGILDQQRFEIAAYEHELNSQLFVEEQTLQKLPLAFDVEANKAAIREMGEAVLTQRNKTRALDRLALRRFNEQEQINVAPSAVRIVARNLAARYDGQIPDHERWASGIRRGNVRGGLFEAAHEAR